MGTKNKACMKQKKAGTAQRATPANIVRMNSRMSDNYFATQK